MSGQKALLELERAIGEDNNEFNTLLDDYLEKGYCLHTPGTNGLTLFTRLVSHGMERLTQLNHILSKMSSEDMIKVDGNGEDFLKIARRLGHKELLGKCSVMLLEETPKTLTFSQVRIESLERAIDLNNQKDFVILLEQYLKEGQNINQIGSHGFTLLTRLVNAKVDSNFNLDYLLSKMTARDIQRPDGNQRLACQLANQLPEPDKTMRVQLLDSAIMRGLMRSRGLKSTACLQS